MTNAHVLDRLRVQKQRREERGFSFFYASWLRLSADRGIPSRFDGRRFWVAVPRCQA